MATYTVQWQGRSVLFSNWRNEDGVPYGPTTKILYPLISGKQIPSWAQSIKLELSWSPTVQTSKDAEIITVSAGGQPKAGTSSIVVQAKFKAKKVGQSGGVSKEIIIRGKITYTDGKSSSSGSGGSSGQTTASVQGDYSIPGLFPNKRQVAYIIDKQNNAVLNFDGVIKLTVSSQVDIQDEKKNQKKKADYVNNAKDAPDEITLQILQSQVYTNQSKFESGYKNDSSFYGEHDENYDRSRSTYQYLYNLKEARRKVDIYTKLKLYSGFVLKTLTASLDEQTTNGWSGQLVFHEYVPEQDSGDGDDLSGTSSSLQSNLYLLGVRFPDTKGNN